MKRLLTTILSVAAVAICLSAATLQRRAISMSTGQEIPMQDIVPTSCVIDTTADGVTVSYHIENILLEPDSLYAGSYKCIISDFVNSDIEGAPAYPLRRDFIELPFGCSTATLTITKASFKDIPCEMAPAYPFYVGSKLPVFTREHVLPINPCSFGSQSDIAVIDEITSYMTHPYVSLTVSPCQYNSTDKVIRIYTDFEYRINYGPVDNGKVARRQTALAKLNAASNASIIKAKFGPIDSLTKPILPIDTTHYSPVIDDNDGPVYNYFLIITADKYLEAVDEFAAFKRKFGFRTHVSSRASWTPAQIQDTINSYNRDVVVAQQACEKNFHVLLIGGHADVPAMETQATVLNSETMKKETYDYITDYYYSCLNGRNSKGVELGRLPVSSAEEVRNFIDKIKGYILTPPDNESFYHTGAHIAYYDGISAEWHPHIYGSESCRNTVMGIKPDIDVRRLYRAQGNAEPRYYGANQSKANVLPIELQRPNYSWDTDKYDIAEELENGCFYTLYRGHGGDTTYVDPYVTSSDIKNGIFKNHNKLPVFLNFTCLTGNFKNPGCLAESLLTNPYGGGIGAFAATASTNCEANNTHSKTMLQNWMTDSKFESISDYDHDAGLWGSELGRIYDRTFIWNQELPTDALSLHRTAYHLFGDPSMLIWTEQPREYTDSEVWCHPHTINFGNLLQFNYLDIQINLTDDEACYIAIENKETHEITLSYGTYASFPYFDPKKYSMTIYGVNRIPLEINESNSETIKSTNDLVVSPNPANTTCNVGYHFYSNDQQTYKSGILTITNISTGEEVDRKNIRGHLGRIELDVSQYPNGLYALALYLVPGEFVPIYNTAIGTGKLIVQH